MQKAIQRSGSVTALGASVLELLVVGHGMINIFHPEKTSVGSEIIPKPSDTLIDEK